MPAPLKTHWFYILLSLAGGHRHGLGIAREVEALSDGRVRLWPATLYGSLDALCDGGLIAELLTSDERRPDDSERRHYYKLTRAGRTALAAEAERMGELARLARSRIRTGETT